MLRERLLRSSAVDRPRLHTEDVGKLHIGNTKSGSEMIDRLIEVDELCHAMFLRIHLSVVARACDAVETCCRSLATSFARR
jgi:hypothetical protein